MLRGRLFHTLRHRFAHRALPVSVTLWSGETVEPPVSVVPRVRLVVHKPAALMALARPTLGNLAKSYVEGHLDLQGEMRDVIELGAALCDARPTQNTRGSAAWKWWCHTLAKDRKAIRHHYDMSNDFYGIWLDRRRVYSCAYFKQPNDTLDLAQEQKLDHICRKLDLKPGERLLDIGCGWGALMVWAARHYGVQALGITLSEAQYRYAQSLLRQERLENQCEVRLCDYRDLNDGERFDKVASVGMFEHVGLRHLPAYFHRVWRLLKPGGLVLNHGITSAVLDADGLSSGISEFIEQYVFPGGELAHVSRVIEAMSRAGLECWDAECLRPHYAKTLWHWVARLEAEEEKVKRLVGEQKYRVWRVYMAGSAHAFERGWMSHFQLLAGKPLADGSLPCPPTREHVYVRRQLEPQLARREANVA